MRKINVMLTPLVLAENRGAYELAVGINSGTDLGKMDSFLRKLGFELTGGNYSMGLGGGV